LALAGYVLLATVARSLVGAKYAAQKLLVKTEDTVFVTSTNYETSKMLPM